MFHTWTHLIHWGNCLFIRVGKNEIIVLVADMGMKQISDGVIPRGKPTAPSMPNCPFKAFQSLWVHLTCNIQVLWIVAIMVCWPVSCIYNQWPAATLWFALLRAGGLFCIFVLCQCANFQWDQTTALKQALNLPKGKLWLVFDDGICSCPCVCGGAVFKARCQLFVTLSSDFCSLL